MPRCVVTLGTFDGVHRGHQAIIRRVVSRARTLKANSVALAFGMPPRHAGEGMVKPILLTTLPEKLEILRRFGIQKIQILIFDKKTASTSPEDFFTQTILKRNGALEMVVGPRVAFGRNRAGRLPFLKQLGRRYHIRIHVVGAVQGRSGPVSSRRIRSLLAEGNVEKTTALLGYPYSVAGRVVHGSGRGRRLGYPTANIQVDPAKILPPGVFWVKVLPANSPFPLSVGELRKAADGLCNVGTRPTFTPQSETMHCEVFLLKGASSLYGRRLRIVFLRRIRPEKRFKSPEQLKRRINEDFQKAKAWAS